MPCFYIFTVKSMALLKRVFKDMVISNFYINWRIFKDAFHSFKYSEATILLIIYILEELFWLRFLI